MRVLSSLRVLTTLCTRIATQLMQKRSVMYTARESLVAVEAKRASLAKQHAQVCTVLPTITRAKQGAEAVVGCIAAVCVLSNIRLCDLHPRGFRVQSRCALPCSHECACSRAYTHTHACAHTRARTHTHTPTHSHTVTHTHTPHTHTHTHAHPHTPTHPD